MTDTARTTACRTCGATIHWVPNSPAGRRWRPDHAGDWRDLSGSVGDLGIGGHRHQPEEDPATEPTVTRLTVTDSTLLVLRFGGSIPEDVEDAVAALRDTTPGSVIVVDDTIREVLAVQRTDAVEALRDALPADLLNEWGAARIAQSALDALAEAGWALIRLDQ